MKILIELNKRLYKYVNHHTLTTSEIDEICDVIANGILLPKEHGRLSDMDELVGICNSSERKVKQIWE